PVRRVACNNYAFGGNNASTILDLSPGAAPVREVARRPVAITGAGVVSAAGLDRTAFDRALEAGEAFAVDEADADRPAARGRGLGGEGRRPAGGVHRRGGGQRGGPGPAGLRPGAWGRGGLRRGRGGRRRAGGAGARLRLLRPPAEAFARTSAMVRYAIEAA